MRARSGSEVRALMGMVRVARAEREEGSLPVMVACVGFVFRFARLAGESDIY